MKERPAWHIYDYRTLPVHMASGYPNFLKTDQIYKIILDELIIGFKKKLLI